MKELRKHYGGRKPKSYLLAHNHITQTPDFPRWSERFTADFGYHRNGSDRAGGNAHVVGGTAYDTPDSCYPIDVVKSGARCRVSGRDIRRVNTSRREGRKRNEILRR